MGWFDDNRDAHQQMYNDNDNYQQDDQQHQAKFSHELIGGAAAFEAMKAYEDSQRRKGEAVSHGTAKEVLAGLAGAEVDRLFETKGLDEYDRIEAKRHAERSVQGMYDDHYVRDQGADQYNPNQYDQPNFNY